MWANGGRALPIAVAATYGLAHYAMVRRGCRGGGAAAVWGMGRRHYTQHKTTTTTTK
jgi:hypothetical protein